MDDFDDDLEDYSPETIGDPDDLLARLNQKQQEQDPSIDNPPDQGKKRGRPKGATSTYVKKKKKKESLPPGALPIEPPPQLKQPQPTAILNGCPIEDQPFIGFLLMKWNKLDEEIAHLSLPITALRSEQKYLEKLAAEFREEFFPDDTP